MTDEPQAPEIPDPVVPSPANKAPEPFVLPKRVKKPEPDNTPPAARTATPLTDPRSLGGSIAFHALLLVLASVLALGVVAPGEEPAVKALMGELGPVDNRAPSSGGGGGPGELGGSGKLAASPAMEAVAAALPDPSADALLSEALPMMAPADLKTPTLPGPLTSGLGAFPAAGTGGGGGSGGGSGGGVGKGIGPGTAFFGTREHASSFAYVIDCSGSMAVHRSLEVAKRELLSSLGQLPPDARFCVIFYNVQSTTLSDAAGRPGMMSATAANKARMQELLNNIQPYGGTNHMLALRAALAYRPEVVFFLTDADLMTRRDSIEIQAEAGASRIQAVEFGLGPSLSDTNPLRNLATSTGGTYRYIDVTQFTAPKPRG